MLPVAPLWLGGLSVVNYLATHLAEAVFDGASYYHSIYPAGHAAIEIQEAVVEVIIAVAAALAVARAQPRVAAPAPGRDRPTR